MTAPGPLERVDLDEVARILRDAGAVFAYLHGSVASGAARPGSDVDVAAHFDGADPAPWSVRLPPGVDLIVLDSAPLELAGRTALHGKLLFEHDPSRRVRWEAQTRKIYLDERHRAEQATRDLIAGVRASVAEHEHG
ncbi:MAG: nucleotidyltransferase domain-containing protein [Nitriliruptorales bacterium]